MDRTIILVTHHVDLCLPRASYLVELSGGRIVRQGSSVELRSQGELQELTAEHREEGDEPKDSEEEPENPHHTVPENAADGRLTEAEARAEGRVSLSTYLLYIRAAGWVPWIFSFVLVLSIRGVAFGEQVNSFFLGYRRMRF